MTDSPSPSSPPAISWRSFWRDERVLQLVAQVLFVLVLLWVGYALTQNMLAALRKQGITLGFDFLDDGAGFDLGETLIPYTNADTFTRALQVGFLNTVLVCVLGILLATVLGVAVGVARLSTNFLVNRLAWLFVEAMRNVPLLVLLVFIYAGIFLKLPRVRQALALPGAIYLSNRGVAIPWGQPTEAFGLYLLWLSAAVVVAFAGGAALALYGRRIGRPQPVVVVTGLAFLLVAGLGWFLQPAAPLALEVPAIQGLNFRGGLTLSPEFMALLSGLVIYTAAFIGEGVRAGIQAVAKGQTEAAHALGLTDWRTLQLVVFPQALRVIIQPLTSQYLNLAKNSTLAVAIGYPDLFAVSGTIINQTGRAVEMLAVIMTIYLSVSLITSAVMNWYNRRVRLVER